MANSTAGVDIPRSAGRKRVSQLPDRQRVIFMPGGAGHERPGFVPGSRFNCFWITGDHTVWVAGQGGNSMVANGDNHTTTHLPEVVSMPKGLVGKPVQVLQADSDWVFVLTDKGDIAFWGTNNHDVGGQGTTNNIDQPRLLNADFITPRSGIIGREIVQVSTDGIGCSNNHAQSAWFRCADGTMWHIGYNGSGQGGDGTTTHHNAGVPVQMTYEDSSPVTDAVWFVYGGNQYGHGLMLNAKGELHYCGHVTGFGTAGGGPTSGNLTRFRHISELPLGPKQVVKSFMSHEVRDTCLIVYENGDIYFAGCGAWHSAQSGSTDNVSTYTNIRPNFPEWNAKTLLGLHSIGGYATHHAWFDDGSWWWWGSGHGLKPTSDADASINAPWRVTGSNWIRHDSAAHVLSTDDDYEEFDQPFIQKMVGCGNYSYGNNGDNDGGMVLTKDGRIGIWGRNNRLAGGVNVDPDSVQEAPPAPNGQKWVDISCVGYAQQVSYFGLTEDGTCYALGSGNAYGQSGTRPDDNRVQSCSLVRLGG